LLLTKFLDTISSVVPGDPFAGREEAIARINPDKIYLENVRSALGVSSGRAQQILDSAVRQGVFQKFVEVVCPDGVAAASASTESELPEMVHCWKDEDGNLAEVDIPTNTLPKVVFYRLR
jgi:hypothetical protein